MTSYVSALRKYAVFSGRATRGEFWPFILVNACIALILNGALWYTDSLLRHDPDGLWPLALQAGIAVPGALLLLCVAVPTIAITVRRLHDTGKTGWCFFIILVPFVGGIVLSVLCALRGDAGTNRFGPSVSRLDAAGTALPRTTLESPDRF